MKDKNGLPEAFREAMQISLGPEEAAQLFTAIEDTPSVSIRINLKKMADPPVLPDSLADCLPQPVPWCSSGYYLDRRPDFIHDPLLHAGTYYVQEAASMIYESVVGSIINSNASNTEHILKVLDLCAAPGGKSTAMLNVLCDKYILVANEYDRSRAGILRENLNKWGDPNVIITSTDAGAFGKMKGYFDIMAVDAPCSGEGMMRREPTARSQWSSRLVGQCASLQRVIIEDVLPALKPGGHLIYSTCTFNEVENEDNCRFFEKEYGLKPVGVQRRFMPHRERCEGLFVAVFQKPEEGAETVRKSGKLKKNLFIKSPGKDIFLKSSNLKFIRLGDRVCALTPSVAEVYSALVEENIHPVSAGIEAGIMRENLFIPSSRQVLSLLFDKKALPAVNVSRDEALNYLRRQPLILPADVPRGYVCVCYGGYPLGLIKNIGSRANNLYPAEWRILR